MKLLILLTILLLGCDKDLKFEFPDDIKQMCDIGFNTAKTCIESKGTPLERKKGVKVVKRAGERYFGAGNGWGWKSSELMDMWVIEVGSNPVTGGDVEQNVLTHEMGHYFLISNHGMYKHDPLYKSCFHNWRDPVQNFVGTKKDFINFYINLKNNSRVNAVIDEGDDLVILQLIKSE